MTTTTETRDYLRGLQDRIIGALERVDKKSFRRDAWKKEPGAKLGGEGLTCVLEGGNVFERAGVSFSHVEGAALPPAATARHPELAGRPFTAMGVSIVIHPHNPYVPTSHMNVRSLSTAAPSSGEGRAVSWNGGGFDLTPYYPFHDDVIHWHTVAKRACDPFGAELYAQMKARCDEYFFLKHRDECRGVGGLFFDDLEDGFAVMKSVGDAFVDAYVPIVDKRKDTSFGERERAFQLYRRGRYVEFNLVLDRGTHFGLQSGGRTESILTSMPPLASWRYDFRPEEGSPEARLADYLKPRNWLAAG